MCPSQTQTYPSGTLFPPGVCAAHQTNTTFSLRKVSIGNLEFTSDHFAPAMPHDLQGNYTFNIWPEYA